MANSLLRWTVSVGVLGVLFFWWSAGAVAAHGVAQDDAAFFLANVGPAIGPYMYLGAKHMFTGYDHLLFLVGVLFFLYRLQDVVLYVSLFTLGHSVTLLAGVLWGVQANSYLVDAIIGFSVVYKAFDEETQKTVAVKKVRLGNKRDGIHFTAQNNLDLGNAIAAKVKDIFLRDEAQAA